VQDYVTTFEARGHEYNAGMSLCPLARDAEREAVLRRLDCRPGQTIMDAPAGGGYVADGVATKLRGAVELVCVEPSQKFAAPIAGRYKTLISPLDRVPLSRHSVDGIVSLAGLHHVSDRRSVYREWARLLKPGGRLAVGDVASDTGTAEFLNVFVDRHTPGGHAGIFIEAAEFSMEIGAAGFDVIEESVQKVPWRFPDMHGLGRFCKRLFGIQTADAAETARALRRFVGTTTEPDGAIALQWELRFATAVRF
jgi:ubiquinone/menaquinone biosynthesis C-methylase UbiE